MNTALRADVTVPDTRGLDTAWWGRRDPGGPTLVLLHEGLGSIELWRDFPRRLVDATGLAAFAYTRAGYGRSGPCEMPRPTDYLHREALDVLPQVLDGQGIGDCVLIGHSDGATIAAIHAGLTHDPRVLGIVLIAPHYFVEPLCLDVLATVRDTYESSGLRRRMSRYHDDVDMAFRGWNDIWLSDAFRGFDLSAALAGITVPVLQIQGRDDPYATWAQPEMADRLVRGPIRTIAPAARHAPHLEAVDETMAEIVAFVTGACGVAAS
jgi:pimeloyl-ACP methyl ester carboxylesterase